MTSEENGGVASEKNGVVKEAVEIVTTVVYALLIALVLRVLLFQPYTIPSASMEPNLYEGDYIVVSKFNYGWSKHSIPFSPPLFNGRIFGHAPHRGDIVVFKLPREAASTRVDYIKRLIGMPGDQLQVRAGKVYINGQPLPRQDMGPGIGDLPAEYAPATGGVDAPITRYQETAADGKKSYLIQKGDTTGQADNTGVYVIPAHCYFMMGDNRDNSDDSRFDPEMPSNLTGTQACGWDESVDKYLPPGEGVGFVPEEDLVGKAQIILLSWKPGSSLFNPTTWLNLRWDRWFHGLK